MSHCLLAKHSSFSEEETLPWDGYEIYLLLLKMNFSVSRRAADRNERVPEVPRHHLENGAASEACPAAVLCGIPHSNGLWVWVPSFGWQKSCSAPFPHGLPQVLLYSHQRWQKSACPCPSWASWGAPRHTRPCLSVPGPPGGGHAVWHRPRRCWQGSGTPCPAQHPVLSLASLEGAFPQCNLFWPHVSRLRSNGSCMPAHPPSVCCLVRLSASFSLGQGIHSLLPFVPSEPLLGCSPRRETEWFLLYQEESRVRLVWCSGTSSGPWVSWIPCCLLDLCGLSCISMVDRKMRHKQICLTQGPTWTAWHKVRWHTILVFFFVAVH